MTSARNMFTEQKKRVTAWEETRHNVTPENSLNHKTNTDTDDALQEQLTLERNSKLTRAIRGCTIL